MVAKVVDICIDFDRTKGSDDKNVISRPNRVNWMEGYSLIYVCFFLTVAKYERSENISIMHLEYQSEKQTMKNAPFHVNFTNMMISILLSTRFVVI